MNNSSSRQAAHRRRATTADEKGNCSRCRPTRNGAGEIVYVTLCPDHEVGRDVPYID